MQYALLLTNPQSKHILNLTSKILATIEVSTQQQSYNHPERVLLYKIRLELHVTQSIVYLFVLYPNTNL